MKFKKRIAVYSLVVFAGVMWWIQHEIHTRVLSPPPRDNFENRFKVVKLNTPKVHGSKEFSNDTASTPSIRFNNRNRSKNKVGDNIIQTELKTTRKNFLTRELLDRIVNWTKNDVQKNPEIPAKNKLQILVIPFSHTDPGWLETLESYFNEKVEIMLDLAVKKLRKFENMTFIWAEIVYLYMWWQKKDGNVRRAFLDLVKSGRLEIVSGSWVMPDESSTHYGALVSTIYEGQNWLYNELGITVNVTWNVDPFGYSGTMPYIWSLFGIKGTYIQRVSARYKNFLRINKTLEFQWIQPWNRGSSDASMLTSIAPYKLYNIEHSCGPIKTVCKTFDFYYDPLNLQLLNNKARAEKLEDFSQTLIKMLRYKAASFRHNTILLPIGDDFRYFDEEEWNNHYEGFSPLMKYINKNSERFGATIKYGTLSEYFRILKQHSVNSGEVFPSFEGDFVPYADELFEYWTGFYTTRPKLKQVTRELQETIKAARIALFLSCSTEKNCFQLKNMAAVGDLDEASKTLGLLQHHDAITGTSPPFTIRDYFQKAMDGLTKAKKSLTHALSNILQDLTTKTLNLSLIPLVVPSIISTENDSAIAFYNPLFVSRSEVFSMLVKELNFDLVDRNNVKVPFEIKKLIGNENLIEVTFLAELPPLSLSVYHLRNMRKETNFKNTKKTQDRTRNERHHKEKYYSLENDVLNVSFDPNNRGMQVTLKDSSKTLDLFLDVMAYESQYSSGAYLFSPKSAAFSVKNLKTSFSSSVFSQQIHIHSNVVKVTITLYNSSMVSKVLASALHISCDVHVSSETFGNKELILRLRTNVNNNDTFYTDSNGFQMMKRKFIDKKLISGNYYPMSTSFIIEDGTRRLTLYSGEPHGVSSLNPGWMEVMLDRLPQSDDLRGIGQGVYTSDPYTARFSLLLEGQPEMQATKPTDKPLVHSLLSIQINDLLQTPVYSLFSRKKLRIGKSSSKDGIMAKLPLDVSLVFITTVIDNKPPRSRFIVRVVFHRRSVRKTLVSCVKFSEVFPGKTMTEIHQTDLRFITMIQRIDPTSCLEIPVHTMTGYQIIL